MPKRRPWDILSSGQRERAMERSSDRSLEGEGEATRAALKSRNRDRQEQKQRQGE